MIGFTLSFEGLDASDHQIDLYDAAQAMIGFQRSLAITTHLILNGEVITQAPSLKNARIMAVPPTEGSWKIPAIVTGIAIGTYNLGTAPKDTPLGNLIHSAYDYVISESLGFHVDYNRSLGQQYEELQKKKQNELPNLKQSNFDSAIEKCEAAITEMHRPIVKSETALNARLLYVTRSAEYPFEHPLNHATYEFIRHTKQDDEPAEIRGRISSYNINTFKGRIFVAEEQRSLPFELTDSARTPKAIQKITRSLSMNAVDRYIEGADIACFVFKNRSRSGILKRYDVLEIQ